MSTTFPVTERDDETLAHTYRLRRVSGTQASGVHPREESAFGSSWVEGLRNPRNNESVTLQFPLRVDFSVDPDNSGVIVEAPLLGLAGAGETYRDAMDDLADSISFLRADLDRDRPEDLTHDALQLRGRLRALIE